MVDPAGDPADVPGTHLSGFFLPEISGNPVSHRKLYTMVNNNHSPLSLSQRIDTNNQIQRTMHTIIEQLNWRYATKQYDQQKKISAGDLSVLKESVRLAPSSFGLQPYKVFVVETDSVREKLREKSWGQPQVTDASHLFVFAAQDTVGTAHIDDFIRLVADTRGVSVEDLQGYSNSMKGATGNMSVEAQQLWSAKQAYIGLGMLLTTAATLNIDASPMEGFDPAGYKDILDLSDHTPVVIAAVGYRSPEDPMQHMTKVRKPIKDLFETV